MFEDFHPFLLDFHFFRGFLRSFQAAFQWIYGQEWRRAQADYKDPSKRKAAAAKKAEAEKKRIEEEKKKLMEAGEAHNALWSIVLLTYYYISYHFMLYEMYHVMLCCIIVAYVCYMRFCHTI